MTTYTGNATGISWVPRTVYDNGVTAAVGVFNLTAALALGDVINLVTVPAGAEIQDVILDTAKLDSGTTPTIVLEVGDSTTPGRFITGATTGQAGGIQHANVAGAIGYTYAQTETDQTYTVQVQVTTAPATGETSGRVAVCVLYRLSQGQFD